MGKNTERAKRMSLVRSHARLWLMEFLCTGPRLVRDIRNAHLARGFSASTINLAARDLRIQKRRNGVGWEWKLPTPEEWRETGEQRYVQQYRRSLKEPATNDSS